MIHAHSLIDVQRNFYGVMRVFDEERQGMTIRKVSHGATLHGLEEVAPTIDTTPHAYYEGALGDLFTLWQPSDVGLLGLGAGTILCYEAPTRHYTADLLPEN